MITSKKKAATLTAEQELLQKQIDGETTAAERAEAEMLLKNSPKLRAEFEGGQVVGALMRARMDDIMATKGEPLMATMLSDINEQIAFEERRSRIQVGSQLRSRRKPASPRAIVFGFVTLAAAGTAFFIRQQRKTESDSQSAGPIIARSTATKSAPLPPPLAANSEQLASATIEEIDVRGATNAIFTIPSDQGNSATTVIWLIPADDSDASEPGGTP